MPLSDSERAIKVQFTAELGFETEQEARAAADNLVAGFLHDLLTRGYGRFAPPLPPRELIDCWFHRECRVIVMWIPDWSCSPLAGLFAVRVDTLADPLQQEAGHAVSTGAP